MNYSYTIWIVLVPLVVFLVTGLFGGRFKPLVSGIIGTTGLFVSFLLSVFTAWKYFFSEGTVQGALSDSYRRQILPGLISPTNCILIWVC